MLTARFVATAKKGRHLDASGLYLEVSHTGKRRWLLRYTRDKKVTEKAIGSAEFVSLSEARIKAFEFRKNLALGILPKKKITFGEIADEVGLENSPAPKHGQSDGDMAATLRPHCRSAHWLADGR
jgi:Arm DNA-binding domain